MIALTDLRVLFNFNLRLLLNYSTKRVSTFKYGFFDAFNITKILLILQPKSSTEIAYIRC